MTAADFRRHARSALSRGAGYEPTPRNPAFERDSVAGYYLDFRAKTETATALSPEQLLPAAQAQLGLGWWEHALLGNPGAESKFIEVCGLLEARSERRANSALWVYEVAVRKFALEPGWVSALSQGQAASLFVRAHLSGGAERHARLARDAIRPLLARSESTVVAALAEGPALEECPTRPPSLILNGWIYAAWGLRDVALGLDSDEAHDAYRRTLECMREVLPRYDEGWWSRYSLYPHRLPDLAKVFYHRLHIDQLETLEHLTKDGDFGQVAARWRTYDTALNRMRLVAQKARFVASGYR